MINYPVSMTLRPGCPDFLDLPWDKPLSEWKGICERLEDLPRGLSRHPVVFVNYDGVLYALKELPVGKAESEHDLLNEIENRHLPSVVPLGYVQTQTSKGQMSVLITRFLENSLPYRILFMRKSLKLYREHLLDAIAGLLVQTHLTGIYWGDCSLSNTLFRRDAGALRAYLVDAETVEIYPDYFPPTLRMLDLQIMEENINAEFGDLLSTGAVYEVNSSVPVNDTGAYIRLRYQSLWEEITREDIINPEEHYRIQDRIRALNGLGFSVGNVELKATECGDQLQLRVIVTDRNFHRDQLFNLTGLDAEEMQAQKMMNEIQEVRATLSSEGNQSTPLSVAAFNWLEKIYQPVVEQLLEMTNKHTTSAELYCQMLEHKWYLSEAAYRDVGHQVATEEFIASFGSD